METETEPEPDYENDSETEIIQKYQQTNNYDFNKINGIRESIENMSKFNQIAVLKILTRHKDVTINENKYGIHINLSELRQFILDELQIYIKYVNNQEIELFDIERQKESYKNTYFVKDNKDNTENTINSKYVT
jgi:hypothetical protein